MATAKDFQSEPDSVEETASERQPPALAPPSHGGELTGWRLKGTITAAFIGLFLSLLDTTIVAVSLPTIADHFGEFGRSTWVINAYLVTYMAFSIIVSRLSDIFSRKAVEVACFVIFIAFSMGCALSQSMTQLIVFRALQGVGGSGLYSMCMVMCFTLVPFEKRSMMSAYLSICLVSAGVLGPILGGAITHSRTSSTWPWIFWINLPIAGAALAGLILAWPSDKSKKTFTVAALSSIDFFGALLLLAASVLLVFALQEAGSYQHAWGSSAIVATLTISGVCFVAFGMWQYWIANKSVSPRKVVFPINLLARRVIAAAIISMLLTGFTYYLAVVNLPQRFQIVSGNSPIMAGVRLLPLMASSGVGSIAGGALNSKRNCTAYTLVAAACFQVVGYGLMTTIGSTTAVTARQYGLQVFLGIGFGLGIVSVTRLMERKVNLEWLAVTQGALAQMRSLGGSIGLAVAVVVLNSQVKGSDELLNSLSSTQETSLLRSPLIVETFTIAQQRLVATVFAEAFTQQMFIATYIAAACFVVSLFTLERHPPQRSRIEEAMGPAIRKRQSPASANEMIDVEKVKATSNSQGSSQPGGV